MPRELRLVALKPYNRIAEGFGAKEGQAIAQISEFDDARCAAVAALCEEALAALDTTQLRVWSSPDFQPIGGIPWRQTTKSALTSYLNAPPEYRKRDLEEWGSELASHMAILLAMPNFQAEYLLVGDKARTDSPGLPPGDAASLRAAARQALGSTPMEESPVRVEWVEPVSLIVLGELDGGLLQALLKEQKAVSATLQVDRERHGPLELNGRWTRVLDQSEVATLTQTAQDIAQKLGGHAKDANTRLLRLLGQVSDSLGILARDGD